MRNPPPPTSACRDCLNVASGFFSICSASTLQIPRTSQKKRARIYRRRFLHHCRTNFRGHKKALAFLRRAYGPDSKRCTKPHRDRAFPCLFPAGTVPGFKSFPRHPPPPHTPAPPAVRNPRSPHLQHLTSSPTHNHGHPPAPKTSRNHRHRSRWPHNRAPPLPLP